MVENNEIGSFPQIFSQESMSHQISSILANTYSLFGYESLICRKAFALKGFFPKIG
jgi:hypothetical protein